MSGKGDKPRPIADREKYNENWDRIFKKDDYPLMCGKCGKPFNIFILSNCYCSECDRLK
jgi:hypothetical protein